jgi:hypothetical protein
MFFFNFLRKTDYGKILKQRRERQKQTMRENKNGFAQLAVWRKRGCIFGELLRVGKRLVALCEP